MEARQWRVVRMQVVNWNPLHNYLLVTPDSLLLTTHYSDSSLVTLHSLLLTPDSLLLTPYYVLLTPDSPILTTLTPDYLLLTPDS